MIYTIIDPINASFILINIKLLVFYLDVFLAICDLMSQNFKGN